METRFFDRLVTIPLFQGLSNDDFMNIASRVHFDFRTLSPGSTIIEAGSACEHLICSINGEISKELRSDNGNYRFREYYTQPIVMQPERLFGLRPRFSATFTAETEVQVLLIPKHEVRDILFEHVPFHINYLNHLCSDRHLWESRLFHHLPESLTQQFLYFILLRSTRPAGKKELITEMVHFANELCVTRLRLSNLLHELSDQGLVELRRRHILIPSLEKLIQYAQ